MSIAGRWRIVEMDLWDQEALDLVGPASIEFGRDHTGSMAFVAVEAWMDCRRVLRDGHPAVEFSWEGSDDGDPASGRGWATLEDGGSLVGHIWFHMGDDSGFRAVRVEGPRRGKLPLDSDRSGPAPRGDPSRARLPSDSVTIIMVMSEIVLPLADIKKRLSEIVDGVEQRHDRVLLTRNGRPAAVIMSPEDLEALEETLDILSDPRAMRAIRKAEVELSEGKFLSAEELRAKYLKR